MLSRGKRIISTAKYERWLCFYDEHDQQLVSERGEQYSGTLGTGCLGSSKAGQANRVQDWSALTRFSRLC